MVCRTGADAYPRPHGCGLNFKAPQVLPEPKIPAIKYPVDRSESGSAKHFTGRQGRQTVTARRRLRLVWASAVDHRGFVPEATPNAAYAVPTTRSYRKRGYVLLSLSTVVLAFAFDSCCPLERTRQQPSQSNIQAGGHMNSLST